MPNSQLQVLPAILAVIGIFAGKRLALVIGTCPHRGKVWGAFVFPLLALPALVDQTPLPLLVSVGAALGAGLTAHEVLPKTVIATLLGVSVGTLLGSWVCG